MITAAVEGDLDEAVARSIVRAVGGEVGNVYGRRGKPSLLSSLRAYNRAAIHAPWFVLIDLDNDCECPGECVAQWLPEPSGSMVFRIAVRAIEAWLLADRERISQFLSVPAARVPTQPDVLANPKETLVNLARHSRARSIRTALVPREGSGRRVGPLYNASLIQFATAEDNGWRAEEAATHSPSLARCLARVSGLV
jgi:hypothetical protein